MHLFGERTRLHTKRGTNVQQEKFTFFAEKTTNNHPTTQTDLHPIPKARIISEPVFLNSASAGCGTLGIKGLSVVGCVMSWAAAAVRRGPECGGMWRLEGRRLAALGFKGRGGGGYGVGEGRGTSQEGKRIPHSLSVTHHMGQSQMLTSNCSKCQASHYS